MAAYKVFGLFLISAAAIVIASALLIQIHQGNFYDVVSEGVLFSLVVFLLTVPAGIFYYKLTEPTKLVRWAFALQVIPIVVMFLITILIWLLGFYSRAYVQDAAYPLVFFGTITLVFYSLGLLFLVVHRLKMQGFTFSRTEGIVSLVIVLIAIFIAGVYAYVEYQYRTISVEKCDAISNLEKRDSCYEQLVYQNPSAEVCEKIQDLWKKDGCYTRKATVYDDPSYCDLVQEQRAKESCKEYCC
jgi:cell division protein FtsL